MRPRPSTDGSNGRGRDGRFAAGNKLGKGSPLARRAASLRAALIGAITAGDIRKIARSLIRKAVTGDVTAIKEVLDRTIGKPCEHDLIERIELLEQDSNHDPNL